MQRMIAIAAMFLAAACTNPVVVGSGRDSVTVQFDPFEDTHADALAEAERHCRAAGFTGAQFTGTTKEPHFAAQRFDSFTCTK